MTNTRPQLPRLAVTAAALLLLAGHAVGRQEAPAPPPVDANGRKILEGPPTTLAFKQVTVEQIIPFIVEASGKVVMPQQDVMSRKITVLNDRPIPRAQALDLVLIALQQNGIAVVETADTITLRDITEIVRQDVPVLGPDTSVLGRTDLGTIAEKVYRLRHSSAANYGDILKTAVPDYAKVTIDKDSNQVAIMGNIALLQRMENLFNSLDRPSSGAVEAETFRLRYADSAQIKTNIEELFGDSARTSGQANRNQQQQGRGGFQFPGQQSAPESTATSGQLRVSANAQQNSVTVVAEPAILQQIRVQIDEFWDRPLAEEVVVPRIYDLKNSDPVKVRTALEGLFGRPSATAGTGGGGGGQGGGQAASTGSSSQGVGRLAGQFSFQALPESGRLVVIAKSPDNLAVIDKIIEDLDRPQSVGLPAIVELKHASAEDLAEQINTLLAQDGTIAQVRRSASGLSDSSSTTSPFSQTTTSADGTTTQETTTADNIAFWWQRSRPPTDRQNSSNLVGQIRIVPVWRQNALMVLAPQEYKNAVVELITQLDQPGRQVLVSAIVCEVSRDDATALGLRWSSSAINPTNADNALNIGGSIDATENNFLGQMFDTSVLNANVDLNVLLQALSQKTKVSILSEPKVFTSDNQEAEFFSGQDIPFITESQPNTQGNLVQSFDYKAVGIQLRVRPRITVKRDVDLRVNLELSSIVPGQTLFGGAIVDRRETTTQLILRNGQTAVISGIFLSEDSEIVRKVPLLGDIPLIGALFRSKEKSVSSTELLVFITPLVVDNTDDTERVNEPYLQRLRERQAESAAKHTGKPPVELPPPPPQDTPPGP